MRVWQNQHPTRPVAIPNSKDSDEHVDRENPCGSACGRMGNNEKVAIKDGKISFCIKVIILNHKILVIIKIQVKDLI